MGTFNIWETYNWGSRISSIIVKEYTNLKLQIQLIVEIVNVTFEAIGSRMLKLSQTISCY